MRILIEMIRQYFKSFWDEIKLERKNYILSLLEVDKKDVKFLDCGCDNGIFSLRVAERLNTKQIYGIEVNKSAIPEAEQKGVQVKKSDLNFKFPIRSNLFDVVVADQVIEHLWDLDNFVSEIHRVLKPGGYSIISTENLASWHNIYALLLGMQPFSGPTPSSRKVIGYHPLMPDKKTMLKEHKNSLTMPPHIKIMTLKALVSLFKSYKFKIEEIKGTGYIPFRGLPSRFLANIDPNHSFFITIKCRKV